MEQIIVPDEVYDFVNEMTEGISDEMTMAQVERANRAYVILQTIKKAPPPRDRSCMSSLYAKEYISARLNLRSAQTIREARVFAVAEDGPVPLVNVWFTENNSPAMIGYQMKRSDLLEMAQGVR